MNFPTVFFACAVFVFVRYIPWNEIIKYEKTRSWISKIAGSGYGIYLMHMIVYRKLEKITMLDPYSYTWRFISPICIYVICVTIVLIMKRIPVVKKVQYLKCEEDDEYCLVSWDDASGVYRKGTFVFFKILFKNLDFLKIIILYLCNDWLIL